MFSAQTRARLEFGLTVVMAVASTVAAVAAFRPRTSDTLRGGPKPGVLPVVDWKSYTSRGERIGSPTAQHVIVEFSDFQCPYCRRFSAALDSVLARHGSEVAVVYRHAPIAQIHPFARAAASAAICAARQGRFVQYHNLLFAKQDSIGRLSWSDLAKRAGIGDTTTFVGCMRDSLPTRALAIDRREADRLGVRGTPFVLVNGWALRGAVSAATIESLLVKKPVDSKSTMP